MSTVKTIVVFAVAYYATTFGIAAVAAVANIARVVG